MRPAGDSLCALSAYSTLLGYSHDLVELHHLHDDSCSVLGPYWHDSGSHQLAVRLPPIPTFRLW